jgi:LPS sulfotransferase NodH
MMTAATAMAMTARAAAKSEMAMTAMAAAKSEMAATAGSDARRFLSDEGEPRAFVIVSSARSGSNLLVSYLRQLSRAACFGEILRADFPEKPGWDKLVSRLDMPPGARQLHARDLTTFWESFLSHGLRRRRWLGAKAFYYHRRGDAIWDRFEAEDHRVLHLWRDATFDQYVSRLLAIASGRWKAGGGSAEDEPEPGVNFDRDDYLRYRDELRTDIEATRARYGGSDRYVEIEYAQLTDHAFVSDLLERSFGERVDVEETLRRQRGRPKLEYVVNQGDAEAFARDSIRGGFAAQ